MSNVAPKKKEILMKSEALVTAGAYNLKGVENKIYYYCLFSAQKENSSTRSCSIKLSDLQNLISNKNLKTPKEIEKILDKFLSEKLKFDTDENIIIEDEKEKKLRRGKATLLSMWECTEDGQYYHLTFVEKVYYHIVNYTIYAPINLEISNQYKSFYSQKLYDLLRLWSRKDEVIFKEFTVDYLRFILGTDNKYPKYKNFKQRVLEQAIEEINLMGNMDVSITKNKNSDKVKFRILDRETKKYFDNKEVAKEQSIEDMNVFVNIPRGIFTRDAATHLIRYCFEESIFFTDKVVDKLLFESIDYIKTSKGTDLIGIKDNVYKEFLDDFKARFKNYFDNVVIP